MFRFDTLTIEKLETKYSSLREDIKYLIFLLKFWIDLTYENTELNGVKNANYIRAILVSFIKLSIIDPLIIKKPKNSNEEEKNNNNNLKTMDRKIHFVEKYLSLEKKNTTFELNSELISDTEQNYEYFRELKTKLNSYCPNFNQYQSALKNASSKKVEKFVNLKTVHFLSEFQAIYLSLSFVRDVFRNEQCSFQLLSLDCFFNGSFLHNFIEDLESRVHPDLFIEELFGRKSIFKHIYYELKELLDI